MFEAAIPLGTACQLIAQRKADAIAVAGEQFSITWGELHRRSNRIARALQSYGVAFGDLVSVVLPNGPEYIELCMATWKLGATPQPLSCRLTESELARILELARPAAVCSAHRDIAGWRTLHVADLLGACDNEDDLPEAVSPSWLVSTSSGSTGTPKLIASAQRGLTNPHLTAAWRICEHDTLLIPAPLHHSSPFICCFFGLFCGARVVLMSKFQEERVLASVDQHAVTWMLLVPTAMHRILRLPSGVREKYCMSSVHTLWHLGAPCAQTVKERWIRWLGPEVIWELYSATDASATTAISGQEWLGHRGSVGRVVEGEIAIVSECGVPVAPGVIGEIYMRRAPGIGPTYRYIGAQARTLDQGGWESVGDIGWMDAEGYLYLADRRTDMILVGGANVYPAEIEAVLEEHPSVKSSAVIGLPDDDLGNRIHAIVQVEGSVDATDLKTLVANRLAPYKRPKTYEWVSAPLRDEAGKVRRYQLREQRLAHSQAPCCIL